MKIIIYKSFFLNIASHGDVFRLEIVNVFDLHSVFAVRRHVFHIHVFKAAFRQTAEVYRVSGDCFYAYVFKINSVHHGSTGVGRRGSVRVKIAVAVESIDMERAAELF